jgi:hypothetical protein
VLGRDPLCFKLMCVLYLDISYGKEISYRVWPCKPFALRVFTAIGISTQDLIRSYPTFVHQTKTSHTKKHYGIKFLIAILFIICEMV